MYTFRVVSPIHKKEAFQNLKCTETKPQHRHPAQTLSIEQANAPEAHTLQTLMNEFHCFLQSSRSLTASSALNVLCQPAQSGELPGCHPMWS